MQVRALALTLCVAYYPAVSALFLDFGPVDKVGTVSGMAGSCREGKREGEREEREERETAPCIFPS